MVSERFGRGARGEEKGERKRVRGKGGVRAYEAWKPQAMLAWSMRGRSSSSGPQAQLP